MSQSDSKQKNSNLSAQRRTTLPMPDAVAEAALAPVQPQGLHNALTVNTRQEKYL